VTGTPTVPLLPRMSAAVCAVAAVPAEVTEHARSLMADALAVAFIARSLGLGAAIEDAIRDMDGPVLGSGAEQGCTVIGDRRGLPGRDAALVNGALIHGLDFDDTHGTASVHPSASVLPSALATAEQTGAGGDAFVRAYVLGSELVVRLGLLAPGRFHAAGLHPTGVLGTFGATLAAALLRDAEAATIATGLGIGLSLTPLTPLEFMTDGLTTKRLHGGWAAVAGMTAAALAAAGIDGPASALEGPHGLLEVLLAPGDRPAAEHRESVLLAGWGERWHFLDVERKRYPVCHLLHPFLACLDVVRTRQPLMVDRIVEVECLIAPGAIPIVAEPRALRVRPVTGYGARFSLPYVVAAAMVDGRLRSERFTEDAIGDETVLRLADRIVHRPLTGADWTKDGVLRIRFESGETLEVAASDAAAVQSPRWDESALAKLEDEDPTGRSGEQFTPVLQALGRLGEGRDDVRRLADALRGLG